MVNITFVFLWLTAYLLGSVPTGKIVVHLVKNQNIQKLGSGNIGTTNVSRVLGLKWAILVFGIDALKAFLPVLAARLALGDMRLVAMVALGALLGNLFSVFLGLKGGKGMATGAGILLNFIPLGVVLTAIWVLLIAKISGKMSVGSLSGLVFLLIWSWFAAAPEVRVLAFLIASLIVYAHRSNIRRLLQGKELGLGQKST